MAVDTVARSAPKHSPGPWRAEQAGFEWWIHAEDCTVVAKLASGDDARLIAAAPFAPHECEAPTCPGGQLLGLLHTAVHQGLFEKHDERSLARALLAQLAEIRGR